MQPVKRQCAGASSGLHHDFHETLFFLLRGRKRVRLYPPDQAKRMYTYGRISKVHANGRIVYGDQASKNAAVMPSGSGRNRAAMFAAFLDAVCWKCIRR